MKSKLLALCVASATLLAGASAIAQDGATDTQALRATLLSLVKTLLDTNVITAAKARELVRQAGMDPSVLESPSPATAGAAGTVAGAAAGAATGAAATWGSPPVAAAPPVVRVPYVPEAVKQQLREEIRSEVLATARAERWAVPETLPSWLARLNFAGDVRVRVQHDNYADDNDSPALVDTFYQSLNGSGQPVTRNTTEDRDRLRIRARLGVTAKVSDEVSSGLRLVTSRDGDANDPASNNVDAGQYSRRFGVAFDLAYIGWSLGPYSVSAGRIANPYLTTDLLWSNDLTLDGIAASWRPVIDYEWGGFASLGWHPVREINNSPFNRADDSFLLGAQAGLQWKRGSAWNARVALGLFDYRDIEGRLNPAGAGDGTTVDYNDGSPLVRQRGNTMFNIATLSNPNGGPVWGIASKFRIVDLSGAVQYTTPAQWRFGASGDVLDNIGYDRDEIADRIGAAALALPADQSCAAGLARLDCRRTRGYRVELSVGHRPVEEAGSWTLSAGVRQLQRDAVPDGWTPGDYRLGGTDVRANYLGGIYSFASNAQVGLRYISAEGIDAPVRLRVDTWQLDLNTRF
jgi:hypothetical protein